MSDNILYSILYGNCKPDDIVIGYTTLSIIFYFVAVAYETRPGHRNEIGKMGETKTTSQ